MQQLIIFWFLLVYIKLILIILIWQIHNQILRITNKTMNILILQIVPYRLLFQIETKTMTCTIKMIYYKSRYLRHVSTATFHIQFHHKSYKSIDFMSLNRFNTGSSFSFNYKQHITTYRLSIYHYWKAHNYLIRSIQ